MTYIYKANNSYYFHLQTPDAQKTTILQLLKALSSLPVKKPNVKVGDLIHVSGTVREYAIEGYAEKQQTDLPLTEIDARPDQAGQITVQKTHQPLPQPVKSKKSRNKSLLLNIFLFSNRIHMQLIFGKL